MTNMKNEAAAEINVNTLFLDGASDGQIFSWVKDAYNFHDEQKLALAVLAMMPRLLKYARVRCSRHENWAIDAVDTAKLRIYMNFFKKDVSSYFIQWCYRITSYAIVDNLRENRGHEYELSLDETGFGEEGEDSRYAFIEDKRHLNPEENLMKTVQMEQISSVLGELKQEEKEVWTMHFVEEKSLGEIAEETGKKPNRVRYLLYNANDHMKARLRAMEG